MRFHNPLKLLLEQNEKLFGGDAACLLSKLLEDLFSSNLDIASLYLSHKFTSEIPQKLEF